MMDEVIIYFIWSASVWWGNFLYAITTWWGITIRLLIFFIAVWFIPDWLDKLHKTLKALKKQ